jgi:crotonobetainyl-CoA:carnitine CoA-transferase CaiB-like acyl-CoA transferase
MTAPLEGLRVLDLTRILAGPTCTQLLADLGAEVIKIERPGEGDDTRKWGPPFIKDKQGRDTDISAYFASSNRNKLSVSIDMAQPEGQALIRKLAAQSDILVENFKVGGLKKYGLDYDSLKALHPGLLYCSITGFGQTGPYAPRAGYDYLAQGMGGIMSLTGEPEGEPIKVGIGIADIVCGLYAANALLAALHHREKTGEGQQIDLSLLDTQVAWLTYEATNYLNSGELPKRQGSEHPNIVPYRVMPCADGFFILAAGNDGQFQRFCAFAGCPELAEDPRFVTNSQRLANRRVLYDLLFEVTKQRSQAEWVEGLASVNVPCGPVNDLAQVFEDPQIIARGMKLEMELPDSESGSIKLVRNPIRYSATPLRCDSPPPHIGQHTREVLQRLGGLSEAQLAALKEKGVL